jgi:PBSX family phage terminase large subunit
MQIHLQPTRPQYQYITTQSPFPALVAGFGAGKTEAAVLRSIAGLLMNPNTNRGFYEPTYDLIRMIAWPRFEDLLTQLNVPYKLQKSPLNMISVEGYGNIIFRSMDNPNRIIGYEHADADIDELDTLKKDDAAYVWRQVLARNRQKKNGQNTIGVTTTPEGFKFVYETWKQSPKKGYEIIQAPTASNPHLPDGYIDSLKDIYPSQLLDAYLEGKFVNLTSGTVYSSYSRVAHRSDETIKPGEPLFIGCDFNVTQQAATVYAQRDGGAVWHAVEQLTAMYDTPEMVRLIQEKWQSKGHKIYMYPDASGSSRKTVNASISDIALLEQAGFIVRAKKTNPAVKDRVLAMNAALEAGRIKINDSACPDVANCLEQQSYKNGEPDKKSGNDHQNDATTYPIAYEMPIVKPVANVKFAFVN